MLSEKKKMGAFNDGKEGGWGETDNQKSKGEDYDKGKSCTRNPPIYQSDRKKKRNQVNLRQEPRKKNKASIPGFSNWGQGQRKLGKGWNGTQGKFLQVISRKGGEVIRRPNSWENGGLELRATFRRLGGGGDRAKLDKSGTCKE